MRNYYVIINNLALINIINYIIFQLSNLKIYVHDISILIVNIILISNIGSLL